MKQWGFALVLVASAVLSRGSAVNGLSWVDVQVRADAVEPPRNVDVTVDSGSSTRRWADVAPGTLLDIGRLEEGTVVRAEVINIKGAGTVRIHILADNCFRATALCAGNNCVAHAKYVASHQGCPNR
jgi:hypothetical protein